MLQRFIIYDFTLSGFDFMNDSHDELPFRDFASPPKPLRFSPAVARVSTFEVVNQWHNATAMPSVASSLRG